MSASSDLYGASPTNGSSALFTLAERHDLTNLEIEVARGLDDPSEWNHLADLDRPRLSRTLALLDLGTDRWNEYKAAGLEASSSRRTQAEMARFRMTLHQILERFGPMTVRGAFYQMVGQGLPKDERSYQRVQDELVKMRRGQRLPIVPHSWIVDGTRWMRKPRTYDSLTSMLEDSIRTYRRALWEDQDAYVEVWCEKDALAGVLHPVTAEWDVPLMVSRGMSSLTFLVEAAMAIEAQDRPAYIYIFTDRDRSGDTIAEKIEEGLKEFAPTSEIHCIRAAVTEDQVDRLGLPTRPAKRKGDPPAVELDAIPPDDLRDIVRDCIERHIDPDALRRTQVVEEEERSALRTMARWAA